MDISVIICTYNRCDVLRQTLETFCQLQIADTMKWELLIVDNNSSDATKAVCATFTDRVPLRYLFQPRQGKNCAQNMGLQNAQGELFVFTDDDVDPDKSWLVNLWEVSKMNPECCIFGGKVLPRWPSPPPEWLAKHSRTLLQGIAIHYDLGDEPRFLSSADLVPFGANLAIRRRAFAEGLCFREDIGPKGSELTTHDETELIRRIIAAGEKCLYTPSAVVHHRNPASRSTERHLRRWYKGSGISLVRMGAATERVHIWFGAPRYLWRALSESAIRYACTRYTSSSEIWLRAEIRMAEIWGMITELRRQARVNKHR